MYNLLIVDDEPVILKSLCEMVQENREEEFTVYMASSADQAFKVMQDVWIDLIMSDIRMPEMDGLQLLRQVEQKWPHCRIIFLTGHSEFEYARQAMSPCVLAYVLKLEGDKKILEELDKALFVIQAEFLEKSRRMALESDLQMARPLLRAECLRQMINTRQSKDASALEKRLQAAGISLDLNSPVLIATVLMQPGWPAVQRARVQETVERLINEYYTMASAMILPEVMLLIVQKRDGESHPNHLLGLMEKAATHCSNAGLYKPRMLLYGEASAISDAPKVYSFLNHRRFSWLEQDGVQLCMPESGGEQGIRFRDTPVMGTFRVEALGNCLRHADEKDYFQLTETLLADMAEASPYEQAAVYTTVVSLLLQAIMNYLPEDNSLLNNDRMDHLTNYRAHSSFREALCYLNKTAADYFQARLKVHMDNRSYVVHVVNRYVLEHLHEGLSLTQLSDLVHLHPSYLSHIYKEATGISVNRYITGQRIRLAQTMLSDPLIKISEIVVRTGLNSHSYFTYYFKKHVGITPQEYRTNILSGKPQ